METLPGADPNAEVVSSRANFDSFGWSIITVFQIIGAENWNEVLYDGIAGAGWGKWACVWCVCVVGGGGLFVCVCVCVCWYWCVRVACVFRVCVWVCGCVCVCVMVLSLASVSVSLPQVHQSTSCPSSSLATISS